MLTGQRRDAAKVLVLVPLVTACAFLFLSGFGLVSPTFETQLSVHSLAVYWAAIPAAVLIIGLYREFSRSKLFFVSAFTSVMAFQILQAINELLLHRGISTVYSSSLLDVLLEFGILSVLLVCSFVFKFESSEYAETQSNLYSSILVITLPVVVYGLVHYLAAGFLSVAAQHSFAVVTSVVAIICFLAIPLLALKTRSAEPLIDTGFLSTAAFLLALSTVLTLYSYLEQTYSGVLAESLQIASYLMFGLSVCIPFLRHQMFHRITSYLIVIALAVATYVPLLTTTIIQSFGLINPFGSSNYLAYAIIHIGAGSLSAIMAVLVFAYSRLKPSRIHYPLILLFVVWSSVAVTCVLSLFAFSFARVGEPVIPYFLGDLFTLILLRRIHILLSQETLKEEVIYSETNLLAQALLIGLLMFVGEFTDQIMLGVFTPLQSSPLGYVLLLSCNYLVLLAFAYLVFLLALHSKGKVSFEICVVGLLITWIVPITLKSFYTLFSLGWWVSELVLFFSLLLGPSILAVLYIDASRDVKASDMRVRLYADLLMHDITNYNQMTLTTLELLSSDRAFTSNRDRLISDARTAVSLTERLIENVRLLNESDDWTKRPVRPIDLIGMLISVLDVVTHSPRRPDTLIRLRPQETKAFAMANELLFGALLNLIYIAIEIPSYLRELSIFVDRSSVNGSNFWKVDLDIPFQLGQENEVSRKIGESPVGYIENTLAFQVSRQIVDQMRGFIETSQVQVDVDRLAVKVSMYIPLAEGAA